MEKDVVFRQRKELKQRAHKVVKGHYFLLIFLSIVMILFGTEFGYSLSGWGEDPSQSGKTEDTVGSILDRDTVLNDIMTGKLREGEQKSDELAEKIQEEGDINKTLGRTNGILAQIVSSFSAGKPAAMLGNAIYSIVKSEKAVAAIFIIAAFLLEILFFTFLKNVYSAAYRRMFLEARVYEHVFPGDILHFLAVRRWGKASWAMLVQYVYQFLWTLTIVGGFIKMFSYAAVPYIVAENPDIGAKEAITLSRKMMDGHKMELFKYYLTLMGWVLLGIVTFGISDMVYGAAYRTACEAEFYTKIREEAIRKKLEGSERLNDPYLFEKADKILLYETYFDVVDEITLIHENKIELKGIRKFLADWFGIWFGTLKEKKQYDDQEGRIFAIRQYKMSMEGKAYPRWLNPLWRKKEIAKQGHFSFLRNYSVWTIFLLFISFSFLGWTWEVSYHFIQTGQFANRGTLFGPWLPIYGTGGVVVLMLCNRFRKNPVAEFFAAIILCGALEYYSAWYLETKFNQRWWSYDGYFLNLHGRICAEGLLVFGVGCCLVVYLVAPIFDFLLSKVKTKILIPICIVLAVLFGIDQIHSSSHPNMAEGAVEAAKTAVQGAGGL